MAILLPICKLLKRKRGQYNQWEPREDTGYGRAAGEEKGEKCRPGSQFILSEVAGASAAFFTVYS